MENTVIIKRIEWVTVQMSTKMLAFSHFVCKICYHSHLNSFYADKNGVGVNCNSNGGGTYVKIYYGTGCGNNKQPMHFIQQKGCTLQYGAEGIYTIFSTAGLGRA